MHLALQNAEIINRLVEQGELLPKTTFYVRKTPQGGILSLRAAN